MLKNIFYSIVIAVFILSVIGAFLPSNVHVERRIDINSPAVTVFTVLNSYRSFRSWSPWLQRDPDAVLELSGPESGRGAKLSWRGDPRLVGSGWQEITESRPNSLLRIHLEFDQIGSASSYFHLDQAPHGVRVTWDFDADLRNGRSGLGGLFARYYGLFFDRWIGGAYDSGLARLKTLVESMPQADFADFEGEIIETEPQDILYVTITPGAGSADTGPDLSAAYQEILAVMEDQDIAMAAQPLTITRVREDQNYDLQVAIPVVSQDLRPSGRVRVGRSPAGRVLRVIHHGPYDRMAPSYEKSAAWMAAHGVVAGPVSWEQYISDPRETEATDLVTYIYFLLDDDDHS